MRIITVQYYLFGIYYLTIIFFDYLHQIKTNRPFRLHSVVIFSDTNREHSLEAFVKRRNDF